MPIDSSFASNFKAHSSHVQGCELDIASNNKLLISVGSDDAFCTYSSNQQQQNIFSIKNNCKTIITSVAIHPSDNKVVAFGTKQGYVILVDWDGDAPQINFSGLIYKTSNEENQNKKIKQLQFSQNGRFLYIAASETAAIVYDFQHSKFYKKKLKNDFQAFRITKDYNNLYFAYLDVGGNVNIFKLQQEKVQMQDQSQSEDPFAELNNKRIQTFQLNILEIATYNIATSNLTKKYIINGSFSNQNSFLSQTLYLPGQTTLQKVQLSLPPSSFTCDYGIHSQIRLQKQILNICWLKSESPILISSSQKQLVLWHEKISEKLISVNLQFYQLNITKIVSSHWKQTNLQSFAFIAEKQGTYNGNIYQFKNSFILMEQLKKQANQNQNLNEKDQEKKEVPIIIQQKIKKEKRKTHQIYQVSKAQKMLPVFPQMTLEVKFEQYNNARFLFYNNIGCIIQRSQGDNIFQLQLQFHDKSHISRIKLPSQIQYCYFALSSDSFIYASLNHFVYQNEKFIKQNNFTWEAYGKQLQGVTIGGEWIAAAFKGAIRIYDIVGNQINNIQFDRPFVSMAAYEDHLAIVYHSSLPMWGVMSLKMNIYHIGRDYVKLKKSSIVPLKPNSAIKWFGFSQEGAIFVQDEHQNLRFYSYEKDQWIIVLSLDPHIQKLFIQHIQGYQIFGFKLNQSPPQQPKVMPRSYSRKLFFDLGSYKADFLSQTQNAYVKQHKLKLLWIQHEKYRNKNWYKFKYSRSKNHPSYNKTENIKSQQDIRVIQAQADLKLLTYIKDYIKNHSENEKSNKNFWQKILGLCLPLAIFSQTRNKLKESLRQQGLIGQSKIEFVQMQNPDINYQKKTKINQLNRLQQMMSLQWAQKKSLRQLNQLY